EQRVAEVSGGAGVRRLADVRPRADGLVVPDRVRLEDVVRPVSEQLLGEPRADERDENQEDDEHTAGNRELVAPEADPDELPVAPCLDRTFGRVARIDGDRSATGSGARKLGLVVDWLHRRGSIANDERTVTDW